MRASPWAFARQLIQCARAAKQEHTALCYASGAALSCEVVATLADLVKLRLCRDDVVHARCVPTLVWCRISSSSDRGKSTSKALLPVRARPPTNGGRSLGFLGSADGVVGVQESSAAEIEIAPEIS